MSLRDYLYGFLVAMLGYETGFIKTLRETFRKSDEHNQESEQEGA